jgi:divalent metal cation (Fe/Co/Zn/Cd) transporter
MQAYSESTRKTVTRDMGITGRLVVGGTVSTGLLLGGFSVAALALGGRINGGALLPTSIGLFLVGAAVGLVVSLVAGLVGRDEGRSWTEAARDAAKGTLYAIPACLLGAILAGWMGMAVIGLYLGKALPIAGSALAAVVGAGIMAATFRVTCESGANALRRVRQVI